MYEARMLGNHIEHLAKLKGLSVSDLSSVLGCTEVQVLSLLKGRSYASYDQISKLAQKLDTNIVSLLAGNTENYNATVVHCMNDFRNPLNREKILDLIDDYVDIVDAVVLR